VGVPVAVVRHDSYGELLDSLGRGSVNVAWLSPVLFVQAHDQCAVTLLVSSIRAGSPSYRSALFVRAESRYETLEELRGTDVAWVSRSSASGFLFARLAMRRQGLPPERLFRNVHFLGSHEAVVEAVASGQVAAGATYAVADASGSIVQAAWLDAARGPMRALVLSPEIPADVICVHDSVPKPLRQLLTAFLCDLHRSPEGASLLRGLFHARAFEPAHHRRYDVVRDALTPSVLPDPMPDDA
jgi:phosphate/phosphite/phosphonate ABC transporter binding protein